MALQPKKIRVIVELEVHVVVRLSTALNIGIVAKAACKLIV